MLTSPSCRLVSGALLLAVLSLTCRRSSCRRPRRQSGGGTLRSRHSSSDRTRGGQSRAGPRRCQDVPGQSQARGQYRGRDSHHGILDPIRRAVPDARRLPAQQLRPADREIQRDAPALRPRLADGRAGRHQGAAHVPRGRLRRATVGRRHPPREHRGELARRGCRRAGGSAVQAHPAGLPDGVPHRRHRSPGPRTKTTREAMKLSDEVKALLAQEPSPLDAAPSLRSHLLSVPGGRAAATPSISSTGPRRRSASGRSLA